jgi:hypothetical protein
LSQEFRERSEVWLEIRGELEYLKKGEGLTTDRIRRRSSALGRLPVTRAVHSSHGELTVAQAVGEAIRCTIERVIPPGDDQVLLAAAFNIAGRGIPKLESRLAFADGLLDRPRGRSERAEVLRGAIDDLAEVLERLGDDPCSRPLPLLEKISDLAVDPRTEEDVNRAVRLFRSALNALVVSGADTDPMIYITAITEALPATSQLFAGEGSAEEAFERMCLATQQTHKLSFPPHEVAAVFLKASSFVDLATSSSFPNWYRMERLESESDDEHLLRKTGAALRVSIQSMVDQWLDADALSERIREQDRATARRRKRRPRGQRRDK